MNDKLSRDYVTIFESRLNDLDKLIETPDIIKQQALTTLKTLEKSTNLYANDRNTVEKGIKALENIKEGSISNNYKVIYAQLCVLATSTLEATLKEYFGNAISVVGNLNKDNVRLQKIRVTAADLVDKKLRYSLEFSTLILDHEKNEFQNLKKIKELFMDYLNKNVNLEDDEEEGIIFYLECRHTIVHKGSAIDSNFIRNVTSYKSANLKNYKVNDIIELDDTDWQSIKLTYRKLVEKVTERRKNDHTI